MNDQLISVQNLKTYFFTEAGPLHAVDGFDLSISRGETVGLIGESGCGKTTAALSIIQLLPTNGRIVSGSIVFAGQDLLRLAARAMREIRGSQIAMVFQETMTSLNPVLTIGEQIAEAVRLHHRVTRRQARQTAAELLDMVGLADPASRLAEYPHQYSGGMRQRVMLAMAIAGHPALLIADEPVAALDAPLQAQILELIDDLRGRFDMAVLLITHNLALAAQICDRVVVMYAGKVAENAPVETIFAAPQHPYTQALLASTPRLGADRLQVIGGSVPDLVNPPAGCRFHPRCPHALGICRKEAPPALQLSEGHLVNCWLAQG